MALGSMAAAGVTAVRRYPLLILTLYAIQLVFSAAAGVAVARILAVAFGDYPLIDLAAAGDLATLTQLAAAHVDILVSAVWTCLVIVALYAVVSWATTAGLIHTLARRPVSRQHTAEVFGTGAATGALAFGRLWLWSLIPYAVVGFFLLFGAGIAAAGNVDLLSVGGLVGDLLPAMAPGLIAWWMVNTAVDFARVDLVRRRHKSALRALLRGFAHTFTSPWPLPHAALFYLLFFGLTTVYVWATAGVEMSAVAYLVVRQVVGFARFTCKIWLIGGQVDHVARRAREPGS